MYAAVFNLCLVAGLLLVFVGVWMVFDLGAAVLALGSLTWFTTLAVAWITAPRRALG